MIDEEKKVDTPDEGGPEPETPEEPTPDDDDGIEQPAGVWQAYWLWDNGSAEGVETSIKT